jgi:hypothetical protein
MEDLWARATTQHNSTLAVIVDSAARKQQVSTDFISIAP